ncbi:hypothetical protein F4810DRAFT_709951 [Camillea tinctor]|nr:hypothetical protein F4810DRAFT_709951 [Camillea tinctor]
MGLPRINQLFFDEIIEGVSQRKEQQTPVNPRVRQMRSKRIMKEAEEFHAALAAGRNPPSSFAPSRAPFAYGNPAPRVPAPPPAEAVLSIGAQNDKLASEVAELEKRAVDEKAQLQIKMRKLDADFQKSREAKITEFTHRCQELSAELQEKGAQISELEQRKERLTSESVELQLQINQLTSELSKLSETKKQRLKELNDVIQSSYESWQSTNALHDLMMEQVKEKQEELEQLEKQIEEKGRTLAHGA